MKKGISLITLIITIVVIIIIASMIVLSLTKNNPINSAKISNLVKAKETLEESIFLYNSNNLTKHSVSTDKSTYFSVQDVNIILGTQGNNNYRIVELKDGVDETSNYKSNDIKSEIIKKDGKSIKVYKLDKEKCIENKIKFPSIPSTNCNWYTTNEGKVYLVYEENAILPDWIKGEPKPGKLLENATLNTFIAMVGQEDREPTIHDIVEKSPAEMFTYSDNSDGTVAITGFNNDYEGEIPENLKFPSKNQEGKNITKIATSAFNSNSKFDSVKILVVTEGIEEIGSSAFNYCTSLEEIYFPSTINKVNSNILQGVNNLKKVTIPNILVASNNQNTNPSNWFSYSKSSIEEVKFSDSITSIGNNAFSGFIVLKSIELPDTITSIGQNAFSNCTTLSGKIELPSDLEKIDFSAFNSCEKVEEYDFSKVTKLKTIGNSAFNQNKLIKKFILPEGIEEIGSSAFNYCTSLEEIYFPSTISKVNSNILQGVNNLKKVTIPNILVASNNQNTNPSNWFSYSKSSIEEVKFSDNITSIGNNAFSGFRALKSIELPDTITSIGQNAFSNCTTLSGKIELPSDLEKIDFSAFNSCEKVEEYDFSKVTKLKTIGNSAFNQNKLIKKFILPEGIEEIGSSVFNYCTSLEEIYFPSTISKVNSNILQGVNNLKKVTIPNILVASSNQNTNPSNWFSYSKNSIEEVKFSDNITSIGNNAFSGFRALKSIELPDTITSIGQNAFSNCSTLTEIKYKGSATGAPWGATNATIITEF